MSDGTVSLANGFLRLDAGHPSGNDTVHKTVSSWAGWRRLPLSMHTGLGTSTYQARAWLAALQPLLAVNWRLAWTPEARAWADLQVECARRRDRQLAGAVRDDEIATYGRPGGGRLPMRHQVQLLRALTEMGGVAGIKDDMGLGKTTSALIHWATLACPRALVVCPKSVKLNWLEEIEQVFALDDNKADDGAPFVYLIDGTASQRANVIGYMRAAMDEKRSAIAIVNYDLLRSMNELAWTTLERWVTGQCVIADEFHYCKDTSSKRTKAVEGLMSLAKARLGLTGTPVRNTVEDLFAQCELLRPGTWLSYHDFANRHLVTSQVQFTAGKRKTTIVRGGKNLDELNRIVNTMWIGRKKTDVLNLPPMIESKPRLELDGVHIEVYQAMKTKARVELEQLIGKLQNDGTVPIFHPLARSAVESAMRCEMIAQGFISGLPQEYADDITPILAGKAERVEGYPNAFVFPDSPKMKWLCETVEEELRDRQVVIFSRFNAPVHWLENRWKPYVKHGGCLKLIGSMDAVARHEALQTFRKGNARILIAQVMLSEGWNAQTASDVIFLGRDWSPSVNQQCSARCHRIGTTGTVNVQIPIMWNTVERFIERKLTAKDADAQQALRSVTLEELLEAL